MKNLSWGLTMASVTGLLLLSISNGRADDSFPPCWRGNAGSTYQSWVFTNSSSPIGPDSFTNPNGSPSATITVGAFGSGWHSTSFGTKTGVWDLGTNGQVSLVIPNFGAAAGPWKYVQVQVTYFDNPGFFVPPSIGIAGATLVSSSVVNNQAAAGGNWKTTNTVWLIQPCPASETVLLTGTANKILLLDQVIVDTRSSISADGDLPAFRPCWRGQSGSTFQQWMFGVSNSMTSIPAELVTNSFGAPRASVALGSFSSGWVNENSFFGCRQGIWDLGVGGTMTLAVSNTTTASSGAYKYVQLQLTQYRDSLLYTNNASVSLAGGTLVKTQQQVLETTSFGAQWVVAQYVWRIGPPVPASESILVTAAANGSLIDQAVVETIFLDSTCPADISVNADLGQCGKSNVTWSLPAVNGCTITNVTSSPTNGSTFPLGTTLVTSVIQDGYGGSRICTFNVIVHDTQPPTVTCPPNIIVSKDPSQCGTFVTYSVTASDNCSATAGGVPASGSLFPPGFTTVTCTATDSVGNVSAPCTFSVQVLDLTGDYAGYVPCWRGQTNTTFQQWAFGVSNSLVTIPPERSTNSYGAPNASVTLGAFSSGWVDQNFFFGCRQGIWDLGVGGSMTLAVPNTTSVSPGAYKYVRLQITQYRDSLLYTNNASISIPGATFVSQQEVPVETTPFGAQWVIAKSVWRLGPPSPATESVTINAAANGSLIDQMVVDTDALDLPPCPANIAGTTDPGQCSKSNVTWSLPSPNGCTIVSVVSTPPSGSTFPVGTNLVTSVITDGEGGTNVCSFAVVITDNQPPVISSSAATEVQPYAGTVDVKNCANETVQGIVLITVQAADQCPLAPPVVGLTNGISGTTASFVNESPSGTFNYTWAVTTATSNGTWTATVTASDTANSTTAAFTLCVNQSQITGQVQLENFLGTGTSPLHTRTVTFKATDAPGAGATVLKTWSLTLSNVSSGTFNYTLTDVPAATVAVSAKTTWNLRKKLSVTLVDGQGTANFTGADKLLGGDVSGNQNSDANAINAADNTLVNDNFLQPMPGAAPADINGTGTVNAADVNFINDNWLKTGDPK